MDYSLALDRNACSAQLRLVQRLRQVRHETPATQFGTLMGCNPTRISRIEHGRQMPTEDEVIRWAEAGQSDRRELLELLRAAEHEQYARRIMEEEQPAVVAWYEPVVIPPPLQSVAFRREVAGLPCGFSVLARIRRRCSRTRFYLGEAALWTRVTSPAVHIEQLDHLLSVLQQSRLLAVGIIPFAHRLPVNTLSGFALYPDAVAVETPGAGVTITDPQEVARFREFAECMSHGALYGQDAGRLIHSVRSRMQVAINRRAAPVRAGGGR